MRFIAEAEEKLRFRQNWKKWGFFSGANNEKTKSVTHDFFFTQDVTIN